MDLPDGQDGDSGLRRNDGYCAGWRAICGITQIAAVCYYQSVSQQLTISKQGRWVQKAMFRLLWPLLMMFGPQLAPRLAQLAPRAIRFVKAVYRLHFDRRVSLLIKPLVPLAIIYAVWPIDLIRDRIPYGLGRYDDFIILGLAIWLFWILCPPEVVREYMGDPPPPRPEDRNPDEVVDGQARPPDDNDDASGKRRS